MELLTALCNIKRRNAIALLVSLKLPLSQQISAEGTKKALKSWGQPAFQGY